MRRFFFGFVWTIVFYLGACMLIGAVIGAQVGARAKNPQAAAQEAAHLAAEKVGPLRPYLLGGAVILATLGAGTGFLPGTRRTGVAQVSTANYPTDRYGASFSQPSNPAQTAPALEPSSRGSGGATSPLVLFFVVLVAVFLGFFAAKYLNQPAPAPGGVEKPAPQDPAAHAK